MSDIEFLIYTAVYAKNTYKKIYTFHPPLPGNRSNILMLRAQGVSERRGPGMQTVQHKMQADKHDPSTVDRAN